MQESRAFKKCQPRKKFILWQLITNFPDFRRNNCVFVQQNRQFKKCHTRGKFILQQIMTNFADFWRNNSVLMFPLQQKKISHFKISSAGKIRILNISCEFANFGEKLAYLWKIQQKHAFKNVSQNESLCLDKFCRVSMK